MIKVHPTAYIDSTSLLGKNCEIDVGAKIGVKGLALKRIGLDHSQFKLREFKGVVVLKDNVHIGAGTIIQRGVTRNTVIGEGTKIAPMCSIGHDVIMGKNCRITGMNQISGYVEIGDNVYVAPSCSILNRIKIGSNACIGIGSLVLHDVPANKTVYGRPAK